ncbi:hypothetical protein ES703_67400 [subsurface metagenome]
MKDITKLLEESNSNIVKGIIASGGVIMGIKVENFKDVLLNEKDFSNGMAEKVEAESGIKGFISTDELPKYGITKEDRIKIEETFECKEKDIVIIVADMKDKATKALELIQNEINNKK